MLIYNLLVSARPRPHLIHRLNETLPNKCSSCARRFEDSEKGKKEKRAHLDWHFRVHQRMAESVKRGQNRSWYVDEEVRISGPCLAYIEFGSGAEAGLGGWWALGDEEIYKQTVACRAYIYTACCIQCLLPVAPLPLPPLAPLSSTHSEYGI